MACCPSSASSISNILSGVIAFSGATNPGPYVGPVFRVPVGYRITLLGLGGIGLGVVTTGVGTRVGLTTLLTTRFRVGFLTKGVSLELGSIHLASVFDLPKLLLNIGQLDRLSRKSSSPFLFY